MNEYIFLIMEEKKEGKPVILTPDQEKLVQMGTALYDGTHDYYYLPFWFKKGNITPMDKNKKPYTLYNADDVPEELRMRLQEVRKELGFDIRRSPTRVITPDRIKGKTRKR